MRIPNLIATALVAAATAGCGSGYLAGWPFGGGGDYVPPSSEEGWLAVWNDAASGDHVLVLVEFVDVLTGAVNGQELANVIPGQAFPWETNLGTGPCEVVGVFDDGAEDRPADDFGYPVTIDPLVEATITFVYPAASTPGG